MAKKRPCRICGRPTTANPFEQPKRMGARSLPHEYKCPSCGQIDHERRKRDILYLAEQHIPVEGIAVMMHLPYTTVVNVLKESNTAKA